MNIPTANKMISKSGNDVPATLGVPQGAVLCLLMFLLYINDINKNISSPIRLFADNCVIYQTISIDNDTILLQRNLDEISNWVHLWQMKFNISKCCLTKSYKVSFTIFKHVYLKQSNNSELSDSYKYFGVLLNSTLSWNPHITNITNKATRMLNFNLGKSPNQT